MCAAHLQQNIIYLSTTYIKQAWRFQFSRLRLMTCTFFLSWNLFKTDQLIPTMLWVKYMLLTIIKSYYFYITHHEHVLFRVFFFLILQNRELFFMTHTKCCVLFIIINWFHVIVNIEHNWWVMSIYIYVDWAGAIAAVHSNILFGI